MEKERPGNGRPFKLTLEGAFEAFRESPASRPPLTSPYTLHRKNGTESLTGVQWADWTAERHLATATAGVLRLVDVDRDRVLSEVTLPDEEQRNVRPPAWASEWCLTL